MTEKNRIEETNIDAPLDHPDFDCLDRAIFAQRIFKIIDGTPLSTNMTIGIYGTWGSGKTTTMNFIKYYCKQGGHPVALYNPWQFHNREDAWKGFVSSIDNGMAEWQGKSIGLFKRQKIIQKISEQTRKLVNKTPPGPEPTIATYTLLAKLVSSLILKPLEGLLKQKKEKVEKELVNILKDKRLFVFIDDLDRAEPDILYDHLMLLNEIVDLSRCVYIVGLDVNVASQVIEKKTGIKDGKEFLDKIINWHFNLPQPTNFDWQELFDKEIDKLDDNIKKDALQSIFSYIPPNPRKFKHFLRYIYGLHKSFLSRFSDEEIDWKILYLILLLNYEFPKTFARIATHKNLIHDIATGFYTDEIRQLSGEQLKDVTTEWRNELGKIIKEEEEENQERIELLYEAFRKSSELIGDEDQIRKYFYIIEDPELLTWKEYSEFKEKLLSLNETEMSKEIGVFVSESRKSKHIERVREFLRKLFEDRHNLLKRERAVTLEEEKKTLFDNVMDVMKICSTCLEIENIFHGINPIFNGDIFESWYKSHAEWSKYKSTEQDKELREKEIELFNAVAVKLKPQASGILKVVYNYSYTNDPDRLNEVEEFRKTQSSVIETLESALAEQLIERFSKVDGFNELTISTRPEAWLLFTEHTAFHNETVYNQLRKISHQASKSIQIHKNFIAYARKLFYAAVDRDPFVDEDAKKLVKRKEFLDIIWNAVLSKRLAKNTIYSLEKQRIKIIKNILNDETALPVPEWWYEVLGDWKDKIEL